MKAASIAWSVVCVALIAAYIVATVKSIRCQRRLAAYDRNCESLWQELFRCKVGSQEYWAAIDRLQKSIDRK